MAKMLFPVTYGIPEKHEGLVAYHICSNGLFMTKRVAGRGTITLKVDGIPGQGEGKENINILPRKIPIAYFWKIREFFRYVEKHFNEGLEAYILLGYNYEKDDFKLYVPKHTVSVASVNYDIESFWKENPGYYLIMDTHSHGSKIGGYFSGTDDKDDNRERFSMVIGKIDNIIPETKIRFSSAGKFFEFGIDDIFTDELTDGADLDLSEGIKKIQLVNTMQYSGNVSMGCAIPFDSGRGSIGYAPGYRGRSLYESIRYKVVDKQYSLAELMGESQYE